MRYYVSNQVVLGIACAGFLLGTVVGILIGGIQ